jgi:hypothetical protein
MGIIRQDRLNWFSRITSAMGIGLGHFTGCNGLLVDFRVTQENGKAERSTALAMIQPTLVGSQAITVGGDKGCDIFELVDDCRSMNVTPHVASNKGRRDGSAIDARTTRHIAYAISQRLSKRIPSSPQSSCASVAGTDDTLASRPFMRSPRCVRSSNVAAVARCDGKSAGRAFATKRRRRGRRADIISAEDVLDLLRPREGCPTWSIVNELAGVFLQVRSGWL